MPKFNLAVFATPNFRQRVLSAVFLIPSVLGIVYVGGWLFAVTVALVMLLALHEWLNLVAPQRAPKIGGFAYAGLLASFAVASLMGPLAGLGVCAAATVVLAVVARGWAAFGLLYLGGAGVALMYLRSDPEIGLVVVAYLLAVVWATDIGAYVAGKLIGGPKLAPRISPGKTWAGLIGGVACAGLAGLAVAHYALGPHEWSLTLAAALLLALVAQGGDLFKSYFKRRAGVKDSGALIPGHGGMLDRIDGLVAASIVLATLVALYAFA